MGAPTPQLDAARAEHPEYWSVEQTASYMRVGRGTLAQWRYTGTGPAYRKVGKSILYRPEDVVAFIEAGARTGTAASA